jgi:hypothetical protein
MWSNFPPFLIYSYILTSVQPAYCSCDDKSFLARIPNMVGFHWTKVILVWPGYTIWAPATLQLVLRELQYVLQYVVIHKKVNANN